MELHNNLASNNSGALVEDNLVELDLLSSSKHLEEEEECHNRTSSSLEPFQELLVPLLSNNSLDHLVGQICNPHSSNLEEGDFLVHSSNSSLVDKGSSSLVD